jgi:hypothetical protein
LAIVALTFVTFTNVSGENQYAVICGLMNQPLSVAEDSPPNESYFLWICSYKFKGEQNALICRSLVRNNCRSCDAKTSFWKKCVSADTEAEKQT